MFDSTKNTAQKYDLKDRFIDYAVRIINLSESLPYTKAGKHIAGQILRSGTAPAANYAETIAAESRADFIHKLKIVLKELRETEVWIQIIIKSKNIVDHERLAPLLNETDELISILFKSIETARNSIKNGK